MTWMRATVLLSLFALNACSLEGHSCTEMGCIDGVSLSLRTAEGTWPDGAYTLTIRAAGTLHTCSMTLPADLPATGSIAELPCDPPLGWLGVTFEQDATCAEHSSSGSVSQSCTPIPDHYTLRAFVQNNPPEVTVAVARDGSTLLEQSVVPSYVESRPNGEDCEPTCRVAAVPLTLP